MPPTLRLDAHRSLQVSKARLSPRYGCGLMLKSIPKFDQSDALLTIMEHYGYKHLAADRPAQRIVDNSAPLRSFYDNTFSHKVPLPRNFRLVYGESAAVLAYDPQSSNAWFLADRNNKMALANYFRDAVSLGVKQLGVMLVGSTVRLTPVGWQNLCDLLSFEFLERNPSVKRVEILAVQSGVRWREPCLGLGVTVLNFREQKQIVEATYAVLRSANGGEVRL